MLTIPLVDLKAQYAGIRDEIDAAMATVMAEASFIKGPHVARFEQRFAAYCGAAHCVGVGNGTDALVLALRALGIGAGDEVIVPANSFVATAEAVTLAGARVAFADVDPATYNLDATDFACRITERTRAVIPVHLYGQPADLAAIAATARPRKIAIVQDCAQAHGAAIGGRPLSAFGDLLCFSFYPGKNLGAYGDAGAVVGDDPALAERVRMLANHGRRGKFDHEIEGLNSRMDGLQGAVLDVKLAHLAAWTERRIAIADAYDRHLEGMGDLVTPLRRPGATHVFHLYVVATARRDDLRRHLAERGVAAGIHYPTALPLLGAYRHLQHVAEDFPVAAALQHRVLSLPIYPEMTDSQIATVAGAIREFFDHLGA